MYIFTQKLSGNQLSDGLDTGHGFLIYAQKKKFMQQLSSQVKSARPTFNSIDDIDIYIEMFFFCKRVNRLE